MATEMLISKNKPLAPWVTCGRSLSASAIEVIKLPCRFSIAQIAQA